MYAGYIQRRLRRSPEGRRIYPTLVPKGLKARARFVSEYLENPRSRRSQPVTKHAGSVSAINIPSAVQTVRRHAIGSERSSRRVNDVTEGGRGQKSTRPTEAGPGKENQGELSLARVKRFSPSAGKNRGDPSFPWQAGKRCRVLDVASRGV